MKVKFHVLILFLVLVFGSYFYWPVNGTILGPEAQETTGTKVEFGSNENGIYYEDFLTDPFIFDPDGVQIGTQKFAIICLRFNSSATRFTIPQLEDLYSTLELFWANASNDCLNVECDVFGWYEFNMTYAEYQASTMNKFQLADAAINLADDDVDYTQYDCIQIMQGNINFRSVSNIGKGSIRDTDDGKINFALSIVAEDISDPVVAVWGEIAHEMGHSIGLPHTHGGGKNGEKDYASFYNLMARMNPGGISGYQMYWKGATPWYDHATCQYIVVPGYSHTTLIDPRYINDATEVQYVIVKITNSLYYRIEVVDNYDEDTWISRTGVLIYLVNKSNGESDCCTDMDSTPGSLPSLADNLDCLWDVGQTFTDAVHNITINILNKDGDAYEVEVINEGSGYPDVMINCWGNPPGDTPGWDSRDIWIDSMVNGWDNYKYGEYSSTEFFGDDPWPNHENRLYARVNNIGEGLAQNVPVYFYESSSMTTGEGENFNFIGNTTIPSINAGQSAVTYIPWTPKLSLSSKDDGLMALQSCIYVVIGEQDGEIDTHNNKAQENICNFEVLSDEKDLNVKLASSVFQPITTTITVNNPFDVVTDLYVQVLNVTNDWDIACNGLGEFIEFQPLETKEFEITIIPMNDIRYMTKFEGYLYIGYEYVGADDGDFEGDNHIENIGGASIVATTCYKSDLDLAVSLRNDEISISGQIFFEEGFPSAQFPQTNADKTILLQIENKDLDLFDYYTTQFDSSGDFTLIYDILVGGNYSIKAFYGGTEFISTSSSETILVDTIHSSVWTSGVFNLFPGFNIFITTAAIAVTTVIILKKRNVKKS